MKTIFLVQEEEADLARKMESKLMSLPLSSGVLFVGVSVIPRTPKGPEVYRVWIGCHRDFDEGLMEQIVRVTLKEEISLGATVRVEAHRGLSRAPLKSS